MHSKNSLGISLDPDDQEFFSRYPMFTMAYMFPTNLAGFIEGDDIDVSNFGNEVKSDPELKNLGYYLGAAKFGRMLATTLPHEEIRRYPTEIPVGNRKENSVRLYSEQQNQLKELIDLASRALRIWK